jgi:hypothetical protein
MHIEENYFIITYGYIYITRKKLFTKATSTRYTSILIRSTRHSVETLARE